MMTTQFSAQFKEKGEDLNPGLPKGSDEKVEKVDKVRRKTTQQDIQLELDLYPLREGETMNYSIYSSIRIARTQ